MASPPSRDSREPDRLLRLERAARAAGGLSHSNILNVHDVGTHEARPYVVLELLEGETLRERLQAGALPVYEAEGGAVQIARGLGAAHEKGIIHRDLKPEKLFATNDGRVKIWTMASSS